MLDQRYEFPLEVLFEPIEDVEDVEEYITRDPAPGIDPIPDAKVIRLTQDPLDEFAAIAYTEMSVESFIRSEIQYGHDPYDILKDVKKICGPDVATEALRFLRTADLTIAIIDVSPEQIKSDQWPTKPAL